MRRAKRCERCGRSFRPQSNRARYCPGCRPERHRELARAYARRVRGQSEHVLAAQALAELRAAPAEAGQKPIARVPRVDAKGRWNRRGLAEAEGRKGEG